MFVNKTEATYERLRVDVKVERGSTLTFTCDHVYIRGGSRGRVQGVRTPPPRDDLRFSNTTGILPKKKLCGLLVLK